MGAGTTCLKVIFVLMSILALIVAAVFAGSGVAVKWFLGPLITPLAQTQLSSIYTSAGLPAARHPTLQTLDLSQILGDPFVLGMIAVGAVAMIALFLGMIGSCCSRGVLIAFLVVYALIWVLQLVVFLLFMLGELDSSIKVQLMSTLDLFQGAVFDDTPSVFWSATQYLLQCCGLDSYSDIKPTTAGGKWNPEPQRITAEVASRTGGLGRFTPMTYPIACCKTGQISLDATNPLAVSVKCTTTAADSNRDKGCYPTLMDYKSQYSTMIYGGVGGWLGFQLLMLIVAICLVVLMKKKTTPREKMAVTEGRDPRSRPPQRPLEPYPETRYQPPERYPEPRYAPPERYPEPRYPTRERYPEPLRVPREPRFVAPSPRPPSPVRRPAPPPYETIPRPRPNANAFFQAQRR